ncbi:MAG: hypothetical protein ACK5RO_13120 [Pseudobdellovibrionaceae bacterium]|jgi:hypothetical protein
MAVQYSLDVKKLMTDLRGDKGVAALKEEAEKIRVELKKLSTMGKTEAASRLKSVEARYGRILNLLHAAQKDLDKEMKKTVLVARKTAKDAEKVLSSYKKLAQKEKSKFLAAFSKKQSVKKATSKKTTKKTTSKASN